jgi:hypothetical protein
MGHVVRIDQRAVTTALQARSQRPFTDVLAQLLGADPDPEAISDFAARHPDRWAKAQHRNNSNVCSGFFVLCPQHSTKVLRQGFVVTA